MPYTVGMQATEVQMRLFEPGPRRWTLSATEVHLGKMWIPRCREALAAAEPTEVRST